MRDDHTQRRPLAPAQEDEIMERSILTQVLFLHPAQLTILELALRVETELRSCEQDAVERAVRDLTRDGLITCDCRRLAPSRAAVRFDELLGGVS
jgi:hypothetical protein